MPKFSRKIKRGTWQVPRSPSSSRHVCFRGVLLFLADLSCNGVEFCCSATYQGCSGCLDRVYRSRSYLGGVQILPNCNRAQLQPAITWTHPATVYSAITSARWMVTMRGCMISSQRNMKRRVHLQCRVGEVRRTATMTKMKGMREWMMMSSQRKGTEKRRRRLSQERVHHTHIPLILLKTTVQQGGETRAQWGLEQDLHCQCLNSSRRENTPAAGHPSTILRVLLCASCRIF